MLTRVCVVCSININDLWSFFMDLRELVFTCFSCYFLSCLSFFAHIQVLVEHFLLVYVFWMMLHASAVHLYTWLMFFYDFAISLASYGHFDHFQCFLCSSFASLHIYRYFDLTFGTQYHCICMWCESFVIIWAELFDFLIVNKICCLFCYCCCDYVDCCCYGCEYYCCWWCW